MELPLAERISTVDGRRRALEAVREDLARIMTDLCRVSGGGGGTDMTIKIIRPRTMYCMS